MGRVPTVEVCIDVVDAGAVARFWSALLDYRMDDEPDADWVRLAPPPGLPALCLQRVPEPKRVKNRVHLDVYVDGPLDWIARAEALGATQLTVHDDPADWFCVMADPGGNEFCICEARASRR